MNLGVLDANSLEDEVKLIRSAIHTISSNTHNQISTHVQQIELGSG